MARVCRGAAHLVEAIEMGTLSLLSTPGVPTREKHGNRSSTLDLTFATPATAGQVLSCIVNNSVAGSEHLPVLTTRQISKDIQFWGAPRRNFKRLNEHLVEQGAKDIATKLHGQTLDTNAQIDHQCWYLVQEIQQLIVKTVPLAKPALYASHDGTTQSTWLYKPSDT